jgi:Glycosyl hydrolase catalytic core
MRSPPPTPLWTRCLLGLAAPALASGLLACEGSSTEVLHQATTSAGGSGGAAASTSASVGVGPGGSGGGAALPCKRGMAYGYNSVADLEALSPGVSWWYNWALQPDNTAVGTAHAGLGIDYVPMAWNGQAIPDLAAKVPSDTRYLLGFNEPNFGQQANMTPTEAAAAWPAMEEFAKAHGIALVSPAVNYCGGNCNVTDPFDWLDQFFAACPTCKVDAIAMHWYACTKDALNFYLSKFESKYKQPLWLTEFSCLDSGDTSAAAQTAYMNDALPILEADPRVARYAWFTGRHDTIHGLDLLGGDGQLTPLGQQYVQYPQSCKK